MNNVVRILSWLKFRTKDRIQMWKKLESMIRNHMSLDDAMHRLYEASCDSNDGRKEILEHIIRVMGHGRTLGEALEGLATPEEIALISSAQKSARLAEGLALAAKILGAKGQISSCLRKSLAEPFFTLICLVAMLMMIATDIVPDLANVLPPDQWDTINSIFYEMCMFITGRSGFILLMVVLVFAVFTFFSFSRLTGKPRRILDKHVPWSIYRTNVGSTWLYTIATRMQAGHSLASILSEMLKNANPYMREIVQAILEQSRHGEDFGTALYASKMNFPSREIVDDMRIYSRMPNFQTHLLELADTWLAQGMEQVQSLASKIAVTIQLFTVVQLVMIVNLVNFFQNALTK